MSAEHGGVATFVLLLVLPMVLMAGLAFDGGQILTARREAYDVAQNAALAGAQAIDGAQVRQGIVAPDPDLAQATADQYLSSVGHTGTVTVTGEVVTVTVTQQVDTQLLSLIGITSKTVTGTARAHLIRGIDGPDT